MYIRLKKYLVRWDEIVQWDIISTKVSVNDSNQVYWLCFSKRHVSEKELNRLVKVALRERGTIAFFQCGAKTYSEIRQHMPSKMRDELDANFGVLDGMMTKKERRLNK